MDNRVKKELDKMFLLMERMDKHYTASEVEVLMENIEELDAKNRNDMTPVEFFNMTNNIKGGVKSTIGYVSEAKLDLPQIKKVNPETNRMKNFPDWDKFGKDINSPAEVTGVIKFSRYTFNWRNAESMHDHYEKNYVNPVNAIRRQYGISPIQSRDNSQPQIQSPIGPGLPAPQSVLGQGYFMQDTGGKDCHKVVQYFLIGTDGHILKYNGTKDGEVPIDVLKKYFKAYVPTGISELRKLNASDETIKEYAEKLAAIKFKYTRFNTGSVAYVITNINGKKLRFFNPNLASDINNIKIDPSEYTALAKKLYKVDDNTI